MGGDAGEDGDAFIDDLLCGGCEKCRSSEMSAMQTMSQETGKRLQSGGQLLSELPDVLYDDPVLYQ